MSRVNRQAGAFTIIELLTVMSIIVVLIGLLVPALNQVKRYAKGLEQRAMFKAIESGLELFRNQFEDYPNSSALDSDGQYYGGAMKLAEAMMGQDLIGFHPDSRFRLADVDIANPDRLYRLLPSHVNYQDNLRQRIQHLQEDNVSAFQLDDIFPQNRISGSNYSDISATMYVLTDVFARATNLSTVTDGPSRVGMPILYYRADESSMYHFDPNGFSSLGMQPPLETSNRGNIYNYFDNESIMQLGVPWDQTTTHALLSIDEFYGQTRNKKILNAPRPVRPDSFILMSAGFDGIYGTQDDITNFENKN